MGNPYAYLPFSTYASAGWAFPHRPRQSLMTTPYHQPHACSNNYLALKYNIESFPASRSAGAATSAVAGGLPPWPAVASCCHPLPRARLNTSAVG